MFIRTALKLASIAVVAAVVGASPASATILNTATQTLSYGPQTPAWTHTFSFNPYVSQGPGTTFNSIHINITGTLTTGNGTLACLFGNGGIGNGTKFCKGLYSQQAIFSLTSSPLSASPTFAPLAVAQTGAFNLIESNFFVSPPIISTATIAGATTNGSYNYYNTVVSSGGTLNSALFTGLGNVNFTFNTTTLAGLSPSMNSVGVGAAALEFTNLLASLTVSLYYDYIDTPEPATLALFGIATLGLVMVRRQRSNA